MIQLGFRSRTKNPTPMSLGIQLHPETSVSLQLRIRVQVLEKLLNLARIYIYKVLEKYENSNRRRNHEVSDQNPFH